MRKEIRTVQRDGKTFQQAYWVADNKATDKGRVPKIPGVVINSVTAELPKHEKAADRFREVQKQRLVGFEIKTNQSVDEETGEKHNWGYLSVKRVGSKEPNQTFHISGVLLGADDVSWGMDFLDGAADAFAKYFSDVDSYDVNNPDDVEAYYQDYGQGRDRSHAEWKLDNHAAERDAMLKALGVELYAYLVYGEVVTVENGEVGTGVEEKLRRKREKDDREFKARQRQEERARSEEEWARTNAETEAREAAQAEAAQAQRLERNKTIVGRIRNRLEERRDGR